MGILIQLGDDFDEKKKEDLDYLLNVNGYYLESIEEN